MTRIEDRIARSGRLRTLIGFVIAGLVGIVNAVVLNETGHADDVVLFYIVGIVSVAIMVPCLLFFRFVWRHDDLPEHERGLKRDDN